VKREIVRMKKISFIFAFLFLFIFLFFFSTVFSYDSSIMGDLKARFIGPAVTGGRITAIDCVDSDRNIIYVGTAGGGVWKSVDGGITFKPIFDKYVMSIGCITVDQKNPNIIWIGTGEVNVRNTVSMGRGLFKSEDGGETWKCVGFENSERISKVLIDPEDSNVVYVGVLGHLWDDNSERGVYKSEDGGKTWKKILYVDEKTGCIDLDMDPQEKNILYASMWQVRRYPYFFKSGGKGSGIYKSIDGGKTWKKITKGLPKGDLGRIGMDISPRRPSTIYALVESKKTGLFKSEDFGESWKRINSSRAVSIRPFYFSTIKVSPDNFKKLYVLNLTLFVSENGGKSFDSSVLSGGFSFSVGMHPDLHAIWIDPNDSNYVLIGTDGGVYRSFDGGTHFEFLSRLPISQFYHVSYDMDYPYHIYGGLQDNGSWMAVSDSMEGSIRNKDWKNIGGADGFYAFRDYFNRDIVYFSWQGGRFEWKNMKTGEVRDITPRPKKGGEKYRFNWNAGVLLSPVDHRTIFLGAQYLFKTTNRGESWEKISPDLTTNDSSKLKQEESGGLTPDDTTAENFCSIYTISQSPLDEDVIWVGTDDGNVAITTDGGKTWTQVAKNIPDLPAGTWCSCIEASHFDKGVAYATFDGHRTGDIKPYVYKTVDFGKHWIKLSSKEIDGYCFVVREDLKNKNLLFLGTEFGLYASFNGGKNWIFFKDVLPKVEVRDIQIHPRENDLIIATYGRGIAIIDDITPLRSISDTLMKERAAVLPSRPAIKKIPVGIQVFPANGEFFGENPPEGAFITYYLKKRHLFGDMFIEIFDKDGKLVKVLPAHNRRGINRVYWNMRLKPPKTAHTSGLSQWVFVGPMVKEGEYTVKLVKNGKEYTGKIYLKPDPRTKYSLKDRELRDKTVGELYDLQYRLAYITDTMLDVKKSIGKILKRVKEEDLKDKLSKLNKSIDTFYNSITQTKGVFVEGKLREKIIDLYSSVISYGGRPTKTQLKNLKALSVEEKKKEREFEALKGQISQLNKLLRDRKYEELRIPSFEEYRKKDEENRGDVSVKYLFKNFYSFYISLFNLNWIYGI